MFGMAAGTCSPAASKQRAGRESEREGSTYDLPMLSVARVRYCPLRVGCCWLGGAVVMRRCMYEGNARVKTGLLVGWAQSLEQESAREG